MTDADRCAICGEIIPEGCQVCKTCQTRAGQRSTKELAEALRRHGLAYGSRETGNATLYEEAAARLLQLENTLYDEKQRVADLVREAGKIVHLGAGITTLGFPDDMEPLVNEQIVHALLNHGCLSIQRFDGPLTTTYEWMVDAACRNVQAKVTLDDVKKLYQK